jgi:hypothetical protein
MGTTYLKMTARRKNDGDTVVIDTGQEMISIEN